MGYVALAYAIVLGSLVLYALVLHRSRERLRKALNSDRN